MNFKRGLERAGGESSQPVTVPSEEWERREQWGKCHRTGEEQRQCKFSMEENSKFCNYRSVSLTLIPKQNYRTDY